MEIIKNDRGRLYEKCVEFHGHSCPGLAIGVRASIEAQRILSLDFSEDEEVVCISENDACGVDGVQVILGCSVGKGNLIFQIRGKQAFNIYNRRTGGSVRLILKDIEKETALQAYPGLESREAKIKYILEGEFEKVFSSGPVKFELPENARLFESYHCEICGEDTAEPYIRLQDGKKCCVDCVSEYHRV